jgi:hypothetical protein
VDRKKKAICLFLKVDVKLRTVKENALGFSRPRTFKVKRLFAGVRLIVFFFDTLGGVSVCIDKRLPPAFQESFE